MSAARWITLNAAADSLAMAASALRRTIERRARLADDGVLEARLTASGRGSSRGAGE